MNKKVVIWGDDHHNALGLLRMLGGRGFDILFIINGKAKQIASASKYCAKYIEIIGIQEGLDYLFSNFKNTEEKAVLLFTADKYSEAANANLERLKDFFYVAGPTKQGVLHELDDKYDMSMNAKECGITIPESILLFNQSVFEFSFFPAIIKPCAPTTKDFKIKVVENKKSYERAIKTLLPDKRYIVQRYIDKKADGLIFGCRTYSGQTLLSGICIRNRWSDDGCGSFGFITSKIPEFINQNGIELFLEKIDFRGLFSVEYAITEDNAYFYEFNLRNDGTSVLFYNAGSNAALAFVNSCFGEGTTESPIVKPGEHYLMNEFWDVFNVKDGIVSKAQWEEDKKKANIFFYYDPDDMKPYEIQRSLTLKRKIRRIISKSWINRKRLELKTLINK